MDMIELNDSTFTKEILDGTAFFHCAENGAMGEPGGIVFVTEDGNVYHANACFGDLRRQTVFEAFPVLTKCRFGLFGDDSVVPSGWIYVNLYCGNHLIVREDCYEEFASLTESYKSAGDMFMNWLEAAVKVVKNK